MFVLCNFLIFDSGAKNVISACRECRVKRLVYNSSADVVFDGLRDIRNGDESLPYPWKVGLVTELLASYVRLGVFGLQTNERVYLVDVNCRLTTC